MQADEFISFCGGLGVGRGVGPVDRREADVTVLQPRFHLLWVVGTIIASLVALGIPQIWMVRVDAPPGDQLPNAIRIAGSLLLLACSIANALLLLQAWRTQLTSQGISRPRLIRPWQMGFVAWRDVDRIDISHRRGTAMMTLTAATVHETIKLVLYDKTWLEELAAWIENTHV